MFKNWTEFLQILIEKYKGLKCCGRAKVKAGANLALADNAPKQGGKSRSEAAKRGSCGLCRFSLCAQTGGGKDPTKCSTMNKNLPIDSAWPAGAKCFLHSGRAHVALNPKVSDMSDVRFRFLSSKKAMEIYQKGAPVGTHF